MPQNVQVVGRLLAENNINSKAALNGSDAIEMTNNHTIDLILLDVQMPEMDGFEVCNRLKNKAETKEIPIIFLTAYNQPEDIIKRLNMGAVDYVTKPFNDVELLQRIKLHLQLRRTQTELEQSLEKTKEAQEKLQKLNKELQTTNEKLSEANQNLKTEREQFLSVLESIPENIHLTDPDSYEIIFANRTMLKTYGADIIGKKCHQVIYKKEEPCDFCPEIKNKNQETPHYSEIYNEHLNKHFYVIERGIKWPDKRFVRFEMAIDITKRKKTEETLREREKELSELNATKDKFFSIIAHDLKNPFNAIIGFSELLMESTEGINNEKIMRYSGQINSSSHKAYKLLENLLEWSRAQTGRIEFSPKDLILYFAINESVETLLGQAEAKEISIQNEISHEIIVHVDENMLDTIIRNLLSNAIKFTPRKGNIHISATKKDGFIEISIADTGVGMSAETIEKLFKISEKVTNYGTENEQGTGLGLLLSKEFIVRHGGDIKVTSEIDKGSIFSFTVPITI
jgi:signal transduction histidine kinase/DNA-binding response OmpR family regulator